MTRSGNPSPLISNKSTIVSLLLLTRYVILFQSELDWPWLLIGPQLIKLVENPVPVFNCTNQLASSGLTGWPSTWAGIPQPVISTRAAHTFAPLLAMGDPQEPALSFPRVFTGPQGT